MKKLGCLERYDKELSKITKGAESSTGMGNTGAVKQSGVKGFEEIAEQRNAIYVP
jgi:hypothetical protein